MTFEVLLIHKDEIKRFRSTSDSHWLKGQKVTFQGLACKGQFSGMGA